MKRRVFKNFDVEDAKNGAKVITRNGYYVRILSYDIKNEYSPILAAILEDDGHERVMQYDEHGEPDEADEEGYFLHIVEEEEVENEDEKMLNSIQECLTLFFKRCKYDKESISKEDILKWIENKKEGLSRSEYINDDWWIARDKDGTLCMYYDEPDRDHENESFGTSDLIGDYTTLDDNLFPEVTWKNSPKRVKVNLELISDEDESENN